MRYFLVVVIFAIVSSCSNRNTKESKGSTTIIQEAIELSNEAATIEMQLSKINYSDTALMNKAIHLYSESIKIDPSNKIPYTQKSNLLCKLGEHDKALETLHLLIQSYPDFAEAYTTIGIVEDVKGDSVQSELSYTKSLRLLMNKLSSENQHQYLPNIIMLYLLKEQKDSALLVMEDFPRTDSIQIFVYDQTQKLMDAFNKDEFLLNFQKQ